jgi:hypothetical protein
MSLEQLEQLIRWLRHVSVYMHACLHVYQYLHDMYIYIYIYIIIKASWPDAYIYIYIERDI